MDQFLFEGREISVIAFNRHCEFGCMQFKTRKPGPDKGTCIALKMLSHFGMCRQGFTFFQNPTFGFDPEFMRENGEGIQKQKEKRYYF